MTCRKCKNQGVRVGWVMSKTKLMSYAPKTREDFIAAIIVCAILFGEGQLFAPGEKGVNL